MPLFPYKCANNHTTLHVHMIADGRAPDDVPCDDCAETAHPDGVFGTVSRPVQEAAPVGDGSGRVHDNSYPYFDRGLQMQIESPEQRRAVMKKRGLVEADQFDHVRATQDARRPMDQAYERYKANTLDRIRNDTTGVYAQYRDNFEKTYGRKFE
jgi:hypothetical protein